MVRAQDIVLGEAEVGGGLRRRDGQLPEPGRGQLGRRRIGLGLLYELAVRAELAGGFRRLDKTRQDQPPGRGSKPQTQQSTA